MVTRSRAKRLHAATEPAAQTPCCCPSRVPAAAPDFALPEVTCHCPARVPAAAPDPQPAAQPLVAATREFPLLLLLDARAIERALGRTGSRNEGPAATRRTSSAKSRTRATRTTGSRNEGPAATKRTSSAKSRPTATRPTGSRNHRPTAETTDRQPRARPAATRPTSSGNHRPTATRPTGQAERQAALVDDSLHPAAGLANFLALSGGGVAETGLELNHPGQELTI